MSLRRGHSATMKRWLIAIFALLPAAIFILGSAALVVRDGLLAWQGSGSCIFSCTSQGHFNDTPIFVILLCLVVVSVTLGIYWPTRYR